MKTKKKKLALPRRQWKISPVTRVKGSGQKIFPLPRQTETGCTMQNKEILKLGLPKGSLQEAALAKMAKAGFQHPGQQPFLCALRGR